jgi:DEAD/DEAH box helicase domain-containing protein
MALLPYASDDRRDGVVGLAFALKQVAQLLLMSDAHDIGISIDTGDGDLVSGGIANPQKIFVYDNYPGGIGFSAPLYQMHHELLTNTRKLIAECVCESGCPGCVGPIGHTGPLAKVAALRILDLLLGPTENTEGSEDTKGVARLGPEEQAF